MTFTTADLYDEFADDLQVAEPLFQDFGERKRFAGKIVTVKCFEDNSLVRKFLEQPGEGGVLVVDGGGSTHCALVGDRLGALGRDNGWSGVVVYGCVRDKVALSHIDIGLKALATTPRKSVKAGAGESQGRLEFAGVVFEPGSFLYADPDGIVVSAKSLGEWRNC